MNITPEQLAEIDSLLTQLGILLAIAIAWVGWKIRH